MTVLAELISPRRLHLNGQLYEKGKKVYVDSVVADALRKNGSFKLTDVGTDGPKPQVSAPKKERKKITKPDEPNPVVVKKVEKKAATETKDENPDSEGDGEDGDDPSIAGAVATPGA